MSVEETVAGVNEAVDKATAATTRLQQAGMAAEEASQALKQATQGSGDQGISQALGLLAEAIKGTTDLSNAVRTVAGDLSAYATSLGGQTTENQRAGRSSGPPAATPPATTTDDPVEELRRQLPPPVTRREQKTHGVWTAPGRAAAALASSRGGYADRVNEVLKEAGCPRLPVTASRDVELQIAAEMRDAGITDATVVINNQPCTGPTSCDGLLGVVLPPGSTLTVYGTDGFKKVYKGGATPWWR
ncbi:DddA-like double-stranded DNA deaminase toxin [Amycolatopsis nalaikhensis]|uniref:SCP1.201-like deaminase n=1 Tax=Amycolatopsis nalaikhensis TaxID=715472 RepID=A0ABY8XZ59_9PSEU|nr:DddA-like double-stranded DNA deaminase toxin [Amycolatopsis sp. 2-2]WIV60701.1 SCP1.201-like deaminase [Amycolatopsis sp. 2-2]